MLDQCAKYLAAIRGSTSTSAPASGWSFTQHAVRKTASDAYLHSTYITQSRIIVNKAAHSYSNIHIWTQPSDKWQNMYFHMKHSRSITIKSIKSGFKVFFVTLSKNILHMPWLGFIRSHFWFPITRGIMHCLDQGSQMHPKILQLRLSGSQTPLDPLYFARWNGLMTVNWNCAPRSCFCSHLSI